ncbi:alpha/beta fold hydrolase [Rhodococcoides fascians]|uniref:alpha/beta fold hydrolase n=1 Tax=Rhodococcoides fascians TaxID=1828 RepID=UPI0037A93779
MPPADFVLVHGAYHGGWSWQRVRAVLENAGHRVFTPSQTGCGDRAHLLDAAITIDTFVDDIVSVIETEEIYEVILVGHSFGARTVVGVADRIPSKLAHLVFLDGGFPTSGRSRLDTLEPAVRDVRRTAADASSGGLSVPPPDPALFGVTDPTDLEWLRRRLTPQPFGVDTSVQNLENELGNRVPSTYVQLTDPIFPGTEKAAAYARSRLDWDFATLPGGHDAMVTNPAAVAEILQAVARKPQPSV